MIKSNNSVDTIMVTIPEMAMELVEKTGSQSDEEFSRTLFVVGSKSAGKTTALYTFLEKSEPVRETLALEYSFGRKTKQKLSICHIWEYGGKLELLTEVLTFVPKQGQLTIAVMVDLSKVKKMWPTLERCFKSIDEAGINKESINIIIIGGMYDLFKNYEGEVKKNISVTIRSVALNYGAHVLFISSKEQALAKKIKDVLYFCGFGIGSFPREKIFNHNKPLCIAKGTDTWDSIGVPQSTIDIIKARHLSFFPMELDDMVPPIVSAVEIGNTEPVLDYLKKKKFLELQMSDTVDMSINDYLKSIL